MSKALDQETWFGSIMVLKRISMTRLILVPYFHRPTAGKVVQAVLAAEPRALMHLETVEEAQDYLELLGAH